MIDTERENTMPTATAPVGIITRDLAFTRDLPGFRGARRFIVEPLGDDATPVFAQMRCTDVVDLGDGRQLENLTLLVTSPGILWPHYVVEIDDETVESLEISGADDVALLVIVHPRSPLSNSTANLFSPIVVNTRTGAADQLVPARTEQEVGWSVATPLPLEGDA